MTTSDAKIILLNGGKNSGKTKLAEHLHDSWNLFSASCKEHLHELTMLFFNVDPQTYWAIYNDKENKETPNPLFCIKYEEAKKLLRIIKDFDDYLLSVLMDKPSNIKEDLKVPLSLREAMIYVSECVCKPAFGKDYFGKVRAENLKGQFVYVDDSAGFVEELQPLIDKVGQDNILLLRVKGRGTFEGDSRSFIPDGVIENTIDIWNTEDLNSFITKAEDLIKRWL